MKRIFSTLAAGTTLAMILSLTGCENDSESAGQGSTSTLSGVWKEAGCNMGFAIDGVNFTEYDNVPDGVKTFSGVIVNSPDLSAQHGLIIVRITDVGTSAPYGAAVGKFTVARWVSFTGTTAGQTNARDADYHPIFYATESEAQALTEASAELNRFCCMSSNRI